MSGTRVARRVCFVLAALIGVVGLLLVVGAGGDNDERATTGGIAGQSVSTATTGIVFLVATATLVAVGVVVGKRSQ